MKFFTFRSAFLGTLIFSAAALNAQDIHFSQFNQSPLTLNPSLAGTTVWIRAALQYRTQWHSVIGSEAYKTIGASFDVKSKRRWIKIKGMTDKYRQSGENGFGWGVNVYNDKAGDGKMNTLQANASLAYQIYMSSKSMLALGMQGGVLQRSIDFSQLQWGTQYNAATGAYDPGIYLQGDKAIAGGSDNFIRPDLSTGMIYTYKKNERYMRGNDQLDFTLGAALFHVNQPKYSFLGTNEKLYQRMVIHGNAMIGISNTSIALAPGFAMMKQGPNQEIFMGMMVRYMLKEDSKYTGFVKGSSISAGGYYRNKDAFVATALFEFSSYGLGVSYDFNVSGLKTVSSGRGGFEITLRFLNPAPFLYSQASFGK